MPSKPRGAVLAALFLAGTVAAAPTDIAAQQAERPDEVPSAEAPDPQTFGHDHGVSLTPPAPPDADPLFTGPTLYRDQLIAAVLARNPGVAEARLAWRVAAERVPQASSLDDPMLAYGVAPLSIGSNDVHFGQSLEVRQRIPYPGRLRRMGEAARFEADAVAQEVEAVRLELAAAASMLYDDYYLVHRALEINAEHRRLLESYQRVVTARYAAGQAPQQAPIRAEVEIAHLVHEEMVLGTEGEIAAARINALLHRQPAAWLPPPEEELPLPGLPGLEGADLTAAAVAARPELARLAAEKAARETTVELRELERYPDFEAMAQYNSMWRETEHRWMVGVGVNLPIQRDRIEAGVAEAEAELARLESERARLVDEIGAEARIAWLRLREAHHVLEIYQSRLVPAAADQVRAALSGFETGQVTFLDLIEAERNQRSVELRYQETLAGLYRRGAELDRALGRLAGAWIDAPPERAGTAGAEGDAR
jgi:outer membrane protein, heavy metal efflux system